jgi:hypothetical protein
MNCGSSHLLLTAALATKRLAAIIGEAEREIFLQKAGELIPTFEHIVQANAIRAISGYYIRPLQ